ncbi:polycomb group protein EMBRYONIC FLOWER 2 isoform X2 [Daucus carota subsp. sativus]|uniref:polycomb group protein EMBRYONIC FLOWER 2 isoform X2 n=1 Tax=Daucus carota subsp. sativus TaxID=79200 RepID=UPI0030838229
MPGRPLDPYINSRVEDQMCRQDSQPHLSPEEAAAAEASLSLYCKPVELYNILQRRAIDKPRFLQRCLRYKMQAKNRRLKMAISLTGSTVLGSQPQSLFPVYVLLAKPLFDIQDTQSKTQSSDVYHYSRMGVLSNYMGSENLNQSHVYFILPEMEKLSAIIDDNAFFVLLISCAGNVISDNDSTMNNIDMPSFPCTGGNALVGEIPLLRLFNSWKESLRSNGRERAVMLTTVDLNPRALKLVTLEGKKCISIQDPSDSGVVSVPLQVPVSGCAEEIWTKDRNPYNSSNYGHSESHLARLRNGNVIFNYKYHFNKLQRTEVTEDFTCAFCLVKGASYEGLKHHLLASHDLFNYEFLVTEECQAVDVTVDTDSLCNSEMKSSVDPKRETFILCSKSFKRRKTKNHGQGARNVTALVLDSGELPSTINGHRDTVNGALEYLEHNTSSLNNATGCSSATAHSYADLECAQSAPGSNLALFSAPQSAKSRKLSSERSDPRNRTLLQKKQFFHSHRAQPMALEQVLSDRDSEDEVDDDVADLEDRRMLDDFVDVTKDEKHMMHLWNSFIRKQRVLADSHIPWACQAFTNLHGKDFILAPALLWCWRLFLIKLWNHGLLDACTINKCNVLLEKFQSQEVDPLRIQAGDGRLST